MTTTTLTLAGAHPWRRGDTLTFGGVPAVCVAKRGRPEAKRGTATITVLTHDPDCRSAECAGVLQFAGGGGDWRCSDCGRLYGPRELADLRPDGWPEATGGARDLEHEAAPAPVGADLEPAHVRLSLEMSPAGLPEVLARMAADGELSDAAMCRLADAARCDAARFELARAGTGALGRGVLGIEYERAHALANKLYAVAVVGPARRGGPAEEATP